MKFFISIFMIVAAVSAQRPFYAGLKPIGYPELADRFQPEEVPTTAATLGNRFGEDGQPITTTTVRLPVDALGDKNLVDRISKWPVDKQPYWYINWKQIEAHRQQRPNAQDNTQVNGQPQRPNQQPQQQRRPEWDTQRQNRWQNNNQWQNSQW